MFIICATICMFLLQPISASCLHSAVHKHTIAEELYSLSLSLRRKRFHAAWLLCCVEFAYRPFSQADFPEFWPFGWDQVVLDVQIDSSWCFLLQPCQNPVFICTTHRAASFYSCAYYLIEGNMLCRVLSYLVKNSSNKEHQSEWVFTMARISTGAVTTDIANKNA